MQKIKIVTTIGPASNDKKTMKSLQDAGANVMRLNFSHGDHEYHQKVIDTINELRKENNNTIAIMLDTKGPEIRTGTFPKGGFLLKKGNNFSIYTKSQEGTELGCSVSHRGIVDDVKIGDTILIDDGLIGLKVLEVLNDEIKTKILNTANIDSYKGVNLPHSPVSLPTLASKDKDDLKFGCKNNVDFVAASFIRTKKDVLEIREFLDNNGGKDIKIISKIESQEGIDNYQEILEVTDGVMVARGDLGVEIPIEELPFRQKELIWRANTQRRFVITATHMLESMIVNPRPTRAEVGDIANAVLDGSDAVMLSGETAKGQYPLTAVQTMVKISANADKYVKNSNQNETSNLANAITSGCVDAAELAEAKAIVALSKTGKSIMSIREKFPTMPIIAMTPLQKTANQLIIIRGTIPILEEAEHLTYKNIIETATKHVKGLKIAKTGDKIAILTSAQPFVSQTTNSFMIVDVK